MPKLTIDGREFEVEPGTTVLQAVLAQGAEVPHYCYHPGLEIAGNCRMCLVEIEKAPKLAIACATPVADGMVVNTNNERVKTAQAAIMEFLLINHPLDCTICDQAGECRLQEYAVEYGTGKSRLQDTKVRQNKAIDIGKHVMLDQERCIQCSRCIRFCDEITGTGELAFFQRGERTIIGVSPGRQLDNAYSGNTVDICPVGALTLKEFRFETRVWYLKNTSSVCAGCARGCNVVIATGKQQEMMTTRGQFDDRIKRLVPRFNPEVNGHWMCDEGRLSFQRLDAAPRLATPQSPPGTDLSWKDAVERVANELKTTGAAARVGVIASPRLTNETLWAWRKVFEQIGQVRLGVRRLERGKDDALLVRADKGANSRGASWIYGEHAPEAAVLDQIAQGQLDTLLVLGDALDPDASPALEPDVRSKLKHLIYVGPFSDGSMEQSTIALPTNCWSEEDGSMVNFEERVQWLRRARTPRGEGRPGWRAALDVANAAGIELPGWTSAAEVLQHLSRELSQFSEMDVDTLGLLGVRGRTESATGV